MVVVETKTIKNTPMITTFRAIVLAIILTVIPAVSFAATTAKARVYTGTVTRIDGTQLMFITSSGAYYTVQTQNISLLRRYGASMEFSEIIKGDKIETQGLLRPDNSIVASYVKNLSLYPHTGTFTGKVGNIYPFASLFTLESKANGIQNVHVNSLVVFKKNNSPATMADLTPGMSVTVKGMWERKNTDLTAKEAAATVRMVDIYFTGTLVMRGETAFTVVGDNNAIYGLDIAKANLQNKSGKPINYLQFNMSDTLRIWGKHVSGSTNIVASKIKDLSK